MRFKERIKELKQKTKDRLIEKIINEYYNEVIHKNFANGTIFDALGKTGKYEKEIPYIGWYWRDTDFYNKDIYIGNAQGYIGVMENNKWGYAERAMTEKEVDIFIEHIDNLAEIKDRYRVGSNDEVKEKQAKDLQDEIEAVNNFFQNLDIPDNSY